MLNPLQSTLTISFAQLSEAGRKPENQDTVGARIAEGNALTTKGIAIAIADGISSSSAARQASQTAITGFLTDYYATPDTWRTGQSANRVIQSLNRYLWSQSQNSVRQEGYLTTLSIVILKGDKLFSFHVGDSRIYRLRGGHLECLTRDHTQKIDRNTTYLSRALGADLTLEVDMQSLEIESGDLYLLSTDGLHEHIDHKTLQHLLVDDHDLDNLCKTLQQTALDNGSEDNISVQLARIESTGTPTYSDAVTALSRLPFPRLLNVGDTVDGLAVEKILYESERSQVYLVKTPEGKRLVMKTPAAKYEDDPAYIERFVIESWIGARVGNAHVVRVVTPPSTRSCLYYLTEYIPGPTLTQVIAERSPLPVQDAVELTEQILVGVRALHRKDTLHQDLKPDNIVIGTEGACIVDFGSCWVAGVAEVGSAISRDKILGTLDYSAPEYRYGGKIGQRSDQFSLAVILYQ
ncbi:MAG TPA: protein phosphatase 2C domain-containing protein, partial [Cellvibrionaceae bacterium]